MLLEYALEGGILAAFVTVDASSRFDDLMTVDHFAAKVGVTTRTVRSYHARGLLPPPVRVGRAPHYGSDHVARMRQVLRLQSRGLPLEAVRALLEPELVLGEFLPIGHTITAAVRANPALLAPMLESGILTRRADGSFEVRSVRAVLAAHAVCGRGASIGGALNLLAHVVFEVTSHSEAALERVRETVDQHAGDALPSADDLSNLTVEVVRLCALRAVRQKKPARLNRC